VNYQERLDLKLGKFIEFIYLWDARIKKIHLAGIGSMAKSSDFG
jgi:hypothetical protein